MRDAKRPGKKIRIAAVFLCVTLLCGCFSASATAEKSAQERSADGAVSWEGEPSEKPEAVLLDEPQPKEEPAPQPEEEPSPQPEPEEPTPQPTEEPELKDTVTVTFSLGTLGSRTVELKLGEALEESQVPEIPEVEGAQVLGWYTRQGEKADPAGQSYAANTTFVARWARQVSQMLETEQHIAYIKGSDHLFRPNSKLSRAEAVQMFYALLRDKDAPQGEFPDIGSQWYAPAVKTMAGLGIIAGKGGYFRPTHQITRAEFVTLATMCDTLLEGPYPQTFEDVPAGFWGTPYIATAVAKGWVKGKEDGLFHPNDYITRAEAVTVINKMLGRSPDARVQGFMDVPEFWDVDYKHWAYGQIVEAAARHSYHHLDNGSEQWIDYQREQNPLTTEKWLNLGGEWFCVSGHSKKFLKGVQIFNHTVHVFDEKTGAAYTGFYPYNGYRWYVDKGVMLQRDISGMGVAHGPYQIKVYKNSNYLIVFAADGDGVYNIPVRAMRTSCGYGTPTGTFYTPRKYRWLCMVGDTWAQWCTQIQGDYLFHSVPNWTHSAFDLEVDEYNHLGDTRSMGCIRLNCRDAKWIFDNCELGMRVDISAWETSGPLPKPDGIQIPSWHTWDPTDPEANWKCAQKGCH